MSEEKNEAVDILLPSSCCASCGVAEVDDVKLKECTNCDLVHYCSVDCQTNHKSEHEEACYKRAAELRDELLFKQPESTHFGDCPICMLPMLLDIKKCATMLCCTTLLCNGCYFTHVRREYEKRGRCNCPFCRAPAAETDEECKKRRMKRVEMNDPVAITCQAVEELINGGDYNAAIEYFKKATKLGDPEAHYKLSLLYDRGEGVEKNEGKQMYHLEEAAIGGHPDARYNLACYEYKYYNIERAVKHLIIGATLGDDTSMKLLMFAFKGGDVSKEDLASTLRAHQAAVDATKSPQREASELVGSNQNEDSVATYLHHTMFG